MASLDKLAIRGIRSFDDKSIAIIQFYSPLTVIVGYNGSGKTTIIECLKYAATGDLPPNTKGGAFVHDPKASPEGMANEREVKAQVRLRFYNVNKKRMNCVRSLQVTQKKSGASIALTMKTLEGLLSVEDVDGANADKRTTISTKCSELDEEIPRQLGVSRSILENVIFCHQEDSNWPLSEPASLKKKFDDIFEATKYTKALDSIKVLRKERTAELKADRVRLDALKQDKERANAITMKTDALRKQLTDKKTEYEELDEEIKQISAANKEFVDKAMGFRETLQNVESLEKRKQTLEEFMASFHESMTELEDTDEELQRRKNDFVQHLANYEGRKQGEMRRLEDEEDKLKQFQQQHARKLMERGQLQAEAQAHERALEDRQELVRKLANQLEIKGYDYSPLEDDRIEEFMQRLLELTRRQDAEVARIKASEQSSWPRDASAKDAELSALVEELSKELLSLTMSKQNYTDRMRKLNNDISTFHSKIDSVRISDVDLSMSEKEQKDAQARLETLTKEMNLAGYDQLVRQKHNVIRDLEANRESLNNDLSALNKQADRRAKLALKRTDVQNKEESIQTMVDRNEAKYRQNVGSDLSAESMETDAAQALSSKETELAAAEKEDKAKDVQVQQLQTNVTSAKGQLRQKKEELKDVERHVREQLGDEYHSIEEAIKESEIEIKFRQDQLGDLEHASAWFERVLKMGREANRCIGCNRDIDEKQFGAFEQYVKDCIKKNAPSKRQEFKHELQEWTQELRKFQELLPKQATAAQLREKVIPALETDIRQLEQKLSEASSAAEQSSFNVSSLKTDVRELQSLKRVTGDISWMRGEIRSLLQEIEDLERELAYWGIAQTVDEVEAQLTNLSDDLKRANRELQLVTNEREQKRTAIANLERDLHKSEMSLSEMRQKLKERESYTQRIEEAREEISGLQTMIIDVEAKIKEASQPIRRVHDEREQTRREMEEKETAALRELQAYQQSYDKLEASNREVTRYVLSGSEGKLARCIEAISELDERMGVIRAEITSISDSLDKVTKELNTSDSTRRNIMDNLRFRELRRDAAQIDEEISKIDLEGALRAYRTYNQRAEEGRQTENSLNARQQHLGGEIEGLKLQIKAREQELKENYKDIHKLHTQQLIQVKTSDLVNDDLEKYAKALDSAIMRYHSIKMEEINEQIQYLWAKTYQGSDIDTIKIRSDNEGARGNRSYNYRVVMTKDNVEMDMRGRCSAGQKVLASIIIRLALADSFGNNCGILALDEPTTNLDRENIEALATSLGDIIRERRHQSNFQLIVITHDEEFLAKLGQTDCLDYFWRVTRDPKQKSVIERHRIQSAL